MNPFDVVPINKWTEEFIAQNHTYIEPFCLARVIYSSLVSEEHRVTLLQSLLEHKCDCNYQSPRNHTALQRACASRRAKCVEILLQHGADPNKDNDLGWTPLMESCDERDIASMKLLLEHKANVHAVTAEGDTAAHYVTKIQEENDVVKSLFEIYGADPTIAGYNKYTVFHYCIIDNNQWLFAWLLQRYPECVNFACDGRGSLLRMCILRRNVDLPPCLLEWAHCDIWEKVHDFTLLQHAERHYPDCTVNVQSMLRYARNRISMQLWAAITLQKSRMLHQYFVQHFLCDYHLWEEWVTWFA